MTASKPTCGRPPKTGQVREAFTRSRDGEYLNELDKQIGYAKHLFLLATVKEVVDNAIDHCEEIGRLPEIQIVIGGGSIRISDNGDGIPPEVLTDQLDFGSKTSSRALYRSLPRGAMGNAALS